MNTSNRKNVCVNLGTNSYTITIGSSLIQDAELIQSSLSSRQICIVTNKIIAEHYLPLLLQSINQNNNVQTATIILPEGEPNKNQATLDSIYDCLIQNKFSRDCLIIALGGGIVGDITGFAAASYQRGVDFIQIPTTLLSQVDSSVGGKTGINHRLGKNLIGAFHQPQAVFIDTNVLNTLPPREIAAGMAEVIKYGLIRDKDFLNSLDNTLPQVMELNPEHVAEIIQISCQHKAQVVENDEKEKGERATLNLGHTFGHAVESLTNYKTYLHGEAVAIGAMMALELSQLLGWVSKQDIDFVESLFQRANCPTRLEGQLDAAEIRKAMQRDKKVAAGKLKLILLSSLGKAVIRDDIDERLIIEAIKSRLN